MPEAGNIKSYLLGFFLSLFFTLSAYFIVTERILGGGFLSTLVISLGLLQAAVQLLLFLHLGKETKPRRKLLIFLFMLLVAAIVVFGSLWIMANLNYHMGGM